MIRFIDRSSLQKFPLIFGDSDYDTELILSMKNEAVEFICNQSWGRMPDQCYFACGVGEIYSIWLFDYDIPVSNEYKTLWVIVGDIPPAYMVPDEISNCEDVLRCYVRLMRDWVKSVLNGDSLLDCVPVNAVPNVENAKLLSSRLDFLESIASTS
jgi:hypothetical protein